ncbi:MAG: transporter substrate-binding domain-containing protein, partial [Flexilinea flocculi]|nr:transporter substrate-binding domain-containing protein [Flexilinea flocculi]
MRKKIIIAGIFLILLFLFSGCQKAAQNIQQSAQLSADDSKLIHSIDDIQDKRIGVLLGSIHDAYATKNYPHATVMQYKSVPDIILAIKAGKIDCAFITRETFLEVMRQDDTLGFITESLYRIPIGKGFSKGSPLVGEFNAFLADLKTNGIFDDMVNRWITNNITDMPDIENSGENGQLKVGLVGDKGLPFTVIQNNRLIGFDVELGQRFAAYLGKEYVPVDMEFGSLIPAVSAGKVDMLSSTLVITDERKKQIDFSDPYYELGVSVFGLKKNIAAYQVSVPADGKLMASLKDLIGKRIGVQTGTLYGEFLSKNYPETQVLSYSSTADMIMALKSSKIDG